MNGLDQKRKKLAKKPELNTTKFIKVDFKKNDTVEDILSQITSKLHKKMKIQVETENEELDNHGIKAVDYYQQNDNDLQKVHKTYYITSDNFESSQ